MLLVGQRLHISHDHHLIRSWGIRHEKRFDIDEVLYQHCVKKLLVGYLVGAQMGSTYKALEVSAPGKLRVVDRSVPTPAGGQVRIRVEACGVCHTHAAI